MTSLSRFAPKTSMEERWKNAFNGKVELRKYISSDYEGITFETDKSIVGTPAV
ncbi:hypothetical protein [Mucilaginibacter defluvii]|uniref:Uncharacterized protein n=1 Tax=Mucilaginibacter defluvii TaxID=1196019 RepID=A0ABP9FTS8_9SPHI